MKKHCALALALLLAAAMLLSAARPLPVPQEGVIQLCDMEDDKNSL